MSYKLGLVKCLIDRAYKINNTWSGFDFDLKNVFYVLKKNCYPEYLLNKITRNYLNRQINPQGATNKLIPDKQRFFKLPYIGKYSLYATEKLRKIYQRYCKENVDVRVVFQSFKIGTLFSPKDQISNATKSNVVYKF